MNATERFKWLFANAAERVCILEAQLEQANETIRQLREGDMPEHDDEVHPDEPGQHTDADESTEVVPDSHLGREHDDQEPDDGT
jgi:hypothetical protein